MKIRKAVITAAGKEQRTLPLQMLIDRDGIEKSVLQIILEEILGAGVDEICVVVRPGDESAYAAVAGDHAGRLYFAEQREPLGYGHAVYCAKEFLSEEPFLHLVGDHLYVSSDGYSSGQSCAQRLVEVAEAEACSVSAVQATRENLLPYYGVIGGQRVAGKPNQYNVETVVEKPTPTQAEQRLIVPGLRVGHYLCFFGMHVLTPTVLELLGEEVNAVEEGKKAPATGGIVLSTVLAALAKRERYLALEQHDTRYDIGVKYGLLRAQLALALNGNDRDEVLSALLELLAQRAMGTGAN